MTTPSPIPTVRLYRRDGCHLCDDARELLQAALEERAMRGEPVARVEEVDIADDPALEARIGSAIPVLAVGGHEATLVTSSRQVRSFLDRTLGRLV